MRRLTWPMMRFGPVNLWTVVPASWFYLSIEEKQKHMRAEQDIENVQCVPVSFDIQFTSSSN